MAKRKRLKKTLETKFSRWLVSRSEFKSTADIARIGGVSDDTVESWLGEGREPTIEQFRKLISHPDFQINSEEINKIFDIRLILSEYPANVIKAPEIQYTFNSVTWIERNLDQIQSKGKKDLSQRGIDVFRDFYLKGKKIIDVEDIPGCYIELINSLQCGALEIVDVHRNTELELILKNIINDEKRRFFPNFNVKDIIIADIDGIDGSPLRVEFVALLAAKAIFKDSATSRLPRTIFLGRGYSIWRIARLSTIGNNVGTYFLPLMAFKSEPNIRYSSNLIAYEFSTLHPGSQVEYLTYVSNGKKLNEKQRKYISDKLIDEGTSRTMILTVNGGLERFMDQRGNVDYRYLEDDYITPPIIRDIYKQVLDHGRADRLAGEFLGWFLDHGGELLDDTEIKKQSEKICSQVETWDKMKESLKKNVIHGMIWLVASGAHKADAVYMMMKQGLVNALVIDKSIAMAIIQKLRDEGKPVEAFWPNTPTHTNNQT